MRKNLNKELSDGVQETAFAIRRYHKHGHVEKVYWLARISYSVAASGESAAIFDGEVSGALTSRRYRLGRILSGCEISRSVLD